MLQLTRYTRLMHGPPRSEDLLPSTAPEGPLRALHVLETLAGLEQPASLATIAATTRLPKSKAYRTLRSLQEYGFIDHLGHSGYRLGSRSVALASLIGPRPALLRAALPMLNRLALVAGETSSLHLRSGAHRVLVLGAESRSQSVRRPVMIGERAPLTSGCSGTAILAHLPTPEARQILRSRPRHERRPSPSQLSRIRSDGYALSFSDNHVGIHGIAAPLLDPADRYPLGSVAVAGADHRLPAAALRDLAHPLKATCKELAPQLARVLGPNSSERLDALDVTIQDLLEA